MFLAFHSSELFELVSMTFLIAIFPPTASELCWYRTHTVNMKDSANFLMGTFSYMQVFIIRLWQIPNFSFMQVYSFFILRLRGQYQIWIQTNIQIYLYKNDKSMIWMNEWFCNFSTYSNIGNTLICNLKCNIIIESIVLILWRYDVSSVWAQ